jgi:hypothetical protein
MNPPPLRKANKSEGVNQEPREKLTLRRQEILAVLISEKSSVFDESVANWLSDHAHL